MGGEGRKLLAGQPRHLSTASKQISLSSHNIKGIQSPLVWGQRQYGHPAEPEMPPWTPPVFAGSITNVT